MLHVVLHEPEIHWNAGNVGRTCLGAGAALHLIEPLGFSLDAKEVRRAGLDYWPKVDLRVHKDWDAFLEKERPKSLLLFSAEAKTDFWDAPYEAESYLVFGKESVGLPAELRGRYSEKLYRIPHNGEIRSLNLSTAAGIVLYEALRALKVPAR